MWIPVWILSSLLFHVVFTADGDCNTATKLERMHGPFSDDTLTDGWYRVDETLELVHEEVEHMTCGTTSPIWAKGEFPDDEDEVRDMDACVVSETASCDTTYQIKVKNCGKYYAYKLSQTNENEAFCFMFAFDTLRKESLNSDGQQTDGDCNTATKLERMHGPFSDDTLTDGWYRVDETLELVHEEVEHMTCGTTSPIWAKGEFPDDEDEVRDMDACVVSETASCDTTYQIKVKNCGKYYAYKLSQTNENEAFCFKKHDVDEDKDCEKQEGHSKRFHRCNRKNRNVVLVIGTVIICIVIVSIVGVCFWKHRRNEAIRRKEGLIYKENPHRGNEPVVVVTDGALPPKKY